MPQPRRSLTLVRWRSLLQGMRAGEIKLVMGVGLCLAGCSPAGEDGAGARASHSGASMPASLEPQGAPPSQPLLAQAPAAEAELPPSAAAILAAAELEQGSGDESESEGSGGELAPAGGSEGEPDPQPDQGPKPEDPLAPILPQGPEPGSAEADAELLALLDESSVSREEFESAFRKPGGVRVEGDGLVFGQPTRAEPVVSVTKVSGEGSAQLRERAEADRQLLACQAMALSQDPASQGSLSLTLELGAGGSVRTVEVESGGLGESLRDCLVSVAKRWKLPAARGAQAITLSVSHRSF